jgi:hypothetical protein
VIEIVNGCGGSNYVAAGGKLSSFSFPKIEVKNHYSSFYLFGALLFFIYVVVSIIILYFICWEHYCSVFYFVGSIIILYFICWDHYCSLLYLL